jgi:hypothetical protein
LHLRDRGCSGAKQETLQQTSESSSIEIKNTRQVTCITAYRTIVLRQGGIQERVKSSW